MNSLSTIKRMNRKGNRPAEIPETVIRPFNPPKVHIDSLEDFKEIEEFFVDYSGLDRSTELALTIDQFETKVQTLVDNSDKQLYWGITDVGQFQLYVSIYEYNM